MQRAFVAFAILEALIIAVLAVLLAMRPAAVPSVTAEPGRAASPDAAPTPASAPVRDAPEPTELPRGPVREATAPPAAADPTRGTILAGRVLDPDGAPVGSASIYVRRADRSKGVAAAFEADRGYAVPPLEPGPWSLTCRADGFKPFQADVELRPVALQTFDVTLERAHLLRVAFVDEGGRPAQAAWAEAKLFVGWRISVVATVDELPVAFPMTTYGSVTGIGVGEWRDRMHGDDLPEKYSGTLAIDAPGAVWVGAVLRQHVLAQVLVPPDQSELDLVIPTDVLRAKLATVRAQVVSSESGAPIEGARVDVSDRQGGGGGQPTGADGRITIENAIPGIVEVNIRAPEREVFHRFVRLHAGEDLDLGVVRLDPPRQVGGVVRNPAGEPQAGVSFRWFRLDRTTPDVPLDNGFSARSDTNGAFKLFGAGAGRYLVKAQSDAGAADLVVDATQGDVTDLDVRLAAAVEVTIVNRVPRTATFLVRVEGQDGSPVASWLERPLPTVPERAMRFVPGRYVVTIREDERVVRTYELDARASGARLVVP